MVINGTIIAIPKVSKKVPIIIKKSIRIVKNLKCLGRKLNNLYCHIYYTNLLISVYFLLKNCCQYCQVFCREEVNYYI